MVLRIWLLINDYSFSLFYIVTSLVISSCLFLTKEIKQRRAPTFPYDAEKVRAVWPSLLKRSVRSRWPCDFVRCSYRAGDSKSSSGQPLIKSKTARPSCVLSLFDNVKLVFLKCLLSTSSSLLTC